MGGRGAQQGWGVGAGPGQGGELLDEGGPMRVGAGAEADLDGERGPGGAVAGVDRLRDPRVEALLGAAVGGAQLGLAGRAGVVLGDGVGGAEDGDVPAQLPVLLGQQQASPAGGGRDRVRLRGLADVTDRRGDLGGAGGEVGPPVRVVGEALRDPGEPGQWAGGVAAGVGGVEAPVEDGGDVGCGVDLAAAQRGGERGDGVLAVGGEQGEVAAEGGPGGAVSDAGDDLVDGVLEGLDPAGAVDGDDVRTRADTGQSLGEQVERLPVASLSTDRTASWPQVGYLHVIAESGEVINVHGDDGVDAVHEHGCDDVGIVDLLARALDRLE